MIIPIRCITCGKVLADKWEYYQAKCKELDDKERNKPSTGSKFTKAFRKEILDELTLDRYCCRRHMLGHVDIIDNL